MFRPGQALAVYLSAIVLAACGTESEPNPVREQPGFRVGAVTARHLVVFRQAGVPADFATAVQIAGGTIALTSAAGGFATVTGLDASGVATLAKHRGVELVDVDPVFTARPVQANPAGATAFQAGLQWNMQAIRADAAWTAGRLGSGNVVAAILDTGLDYTHPDLAGLVDLAQSVDLIGEADSVEKYIGAGRHSITDLNGHGTHVAAVVSSNAVVAAGVSSKTRLVGVKICDMRGTCPVSLALAGIIYGADVGAAVINVSLGGYELRRTLRGFGSLVNRVTNYAHQKGALVVVASGNAALNLDRTADLYNAYCDAANVICVSATGPTGDGPLGPFVNVDAPALYSNVGQSAIDVAAPGGNMILDASGALDYVTPVWSSCALTGLQFSTLEPTPDEAPLGFWCSTVTALGFIGTSQAAPHVSGLAASLAAELGRNPTAIRNTIVRSADDLGPRGTDLSYGKGRINLAAALGLP